MNIKENNNKVIILIGTIASGGASRIALNLYNGLSQKINVDLVQICNTDGKLSSHAYNRVLINNYPKNILLRAIYTPQCLFQLVVLCKKESINKVISISDLDNLINIVSSIFHKHIPIISVHAMPSYSESLLSRCIRPFLYLLARLLKVPVIAVSNGVKDELISIHKISEEQITTLYNPIDIDIIQKKAKDKLESEVNPTHVPLIVTVGRLVDVKGHWHLIRVFAEIQKEIDSQLLIIGEGDDAGSLKKLVSEYGIEKKVIFLGWQENPYKYMAQSTVFALTSLSEALPNVLVESMAVGCPVVAANCSPGIEEIMGSDNTCGIISEKMSGVRHTADEPLDGSEIDFLNNLKKILEDTELREQMSYASKKRAQLFDVNVGIQKYVELIEGIISKM